MEKVSGSRHVHHTTIAISLPFPGAILAQRILVVVVRFALALTLGG